MAGFTKMPVVREALKSILGAAAGGRYTVEGFQRQAHGAEEIVGNLRHVTVFYRQGAFDRSRSGWLQGPFQHGMTFAVQLQLAAPAKIDVASIENAQSAQEFMSALGGMEEAAANADALWDELSGIVYGILMSPLNMIPGTADRWISSIQKDNPAPRGEYVLLTGTMDYTCTGPETVTGAVGVAPTEGVDIDLQATADITGATVDPAKAGAKV